MVKTVDIIDKTEWVNLYVNSSTASYFQSYECYDFYCSLSFLDAFGWGVYENNELKALVCGYIISNGGKLKSFFSRRAIIHGGVLMADDVSEEAITELLRVLKNSLSQKVIYIEIRNNFNFDKYRPLFLKLGFEYHSHLNYKVKISKSEIVETRYSESKIRQIRKAKEQGVVCEPSVNQREIDEFYRILSSLYNRKIRKPLFPKEFFDKFVHQPNCYLFIVKKENNVIGGIACAAIPGKVIYEWFVCGDTENYNHLYPSVIATHTGIEFAAENDYKCFDFMGAGKPEVEYGVRNFKEKFGGDLYELGRFRHVSKKLLYTVGKFVVETIKIF